MGRETEKIEEMLRIALRMFEEQASLLNCVAKTPANRAAKKANRQRLGEIQGYINRARAMLLAPESQDFDHTLTRVKALMALPQKAKSAR